MPFEYHRKSKQRNRAMAPYLEAALKYSDQKSDTPPYLYQHIKKINLEEHDPNKLTSCKMIKWEQPVPSHSISW